MLDTQIKETDEFVALLVEALGWPKPTRFQHRLPESVAKGNPLNTVWYESGDVGNPRTDCFLQVNELDVKHDSLLLSGSVFAIRYRICTGWFPVRLPFDENGVAMAATELSPWLSYDLFESYPARKIFRILHPETVGYSWSRLREHGPPYCIELLEEEGAIVAQQRKTE